jgi:archaellum component FlaC
MKKQHNSIYWASIVVFIVTTVFLITSIYTISVMYKDSNIWKDVYVWWVLGFGLLITAILLLMHEVLQTKTPLSYIPNVWTGLGVFFTFLVIWSSLSSGEYELGKTVVENSNKKDLNDLIKDLTAAFSSSIVGIMGSIITAVAIKFSLSYKEYLQEKNNKQAYTSPEETLWDLKEDNKKHFKILTDVLTETLHTTNSKLTTISESNETLYGLHSLLTTGNFENFYKEMQDHRKETQKVKELLFKIPTNFKEQLETLLDNLNQKLESEIGAMGEAALGQAKENIEEINKDLKNVMSTLLTENKNQLETTLTQLKDTGEASKNTIDSVGKLFSNRIDEMNTHYETNAQNIEEKFETVASNFNTMNEGLQNHYKENADAIQDKFQKLTEVFSKFDEQIQSALATTIDNGVINLDKAFDRIKAWQVSTKGELEQISNSFKDAVEEYTAFKDANKGIIEELREQTQNLRELKEEIANIPEYDAKIEEMQSRISEIGTSIEELGKINELLALKQN